MNAPTTYSVIADYRQFFLLDDEIQPLYPEEISGSDLSNRYKAAPNIVAIYTETTQAVEVLVSVVEAEPPLDLSLWSHVVRCSIDSPSGRLILAGCSDYLPDCPRFKVPKVLSGLLIAGRGFGANTIEQYHLFFWPDSNSQHSILKQYIAPA